MRWLFAIAAQRRASSAMAAGPRIKDLVEFEGVRGNDLVGYGLVVGLNGSGDGIRNAPFTEEARRIHYKETEEKGIYGEASIKEAKELADEGIEFLPLPVLPEDQN